MSIQRAPDGKASDKKTVGILSWSREVWKMSGQRGEESVLGRGR